MRVVSEPRKGNYSCAEVIGSDNDELWSQPQIKQGGDAGDGAACDDKDGYNSKLLTPMATILEDSGDEGDDDNDVTTANTNSQKHLTGSDHLDSALQSSMGELAQSYRSAGAHDSSRHTSES